MIVLGLTGGIAAGKSTVSKMLRRLGAKIWDADEASRRVVKPGEDGYEALRLAFGDEIFLPDRTLNRRGLAKMVFGNEEALLKLNRALHPHILHDMDVHLARWEKEGVDLAVVDAPLLFETGADKACDEIWVVSCGVDEQLRRIMARDGLTEEEAAERISHQMADADRRRLATRVIDSLMPLEDEERYIQTLVEELLHPEDL